MEVSIAFREKMEKLLGGEAQQFFESYENKRVYGLRRNPLKVDAETFEHVMPFFLTPVPWAKEGYYYPGETQQPGKHPYHEAGLYYIQEPSAMAVVEALDPAPGEIICDLCAAPGGKSTQIAGRMQGKGLLISNEIIPNRAKILSQNMERMGVRNAVVLNETMERMEQFFPTFFDRILVDAPCSGEGMFRKNEEAISQWSPQQVEICAARQSMILNCAASMLKSGGVLVYSTCTFSPEENEGVISEFLRNHPTYVLEDCDTLQGMDHGHAQWIDMPYGALERTVRLWPHRIQGEGHFIARLRHTGTASDQGQRQDKSRKSQSNSRKSQGSSIAKEQALALKEWNLFSQSLLQTELPDTYIWFGEHLYLVPGEMCALDHIKVVRPGLHLGTNKKNRFEPAHALALALRPEDVTNSIQLDKAAAEAYLQGNTVPCDETVKGWNLMTVDGFSIGWGKAQDGRIQNHYPKGLRKDFF